MVSDLIGEYPMFQDISRSIDACAKHYGDDSEAMKQ